MTGECVAQDNLTWTVRAAQETYDWNWDQEEGVSYLPLSHVAAQVCEVIEAPMVCWYGDTWPGDGHIPDT